MGSALAGILMLTLLEGQGEGKIVPVHTMKVCEKMKV